LPPCSQTQHLLPSRTWSTWSCFPIWRDLNALVHDGNHHFPHSHEVYMRPSPTGNGCSPPEAQPEYSVKTGTVNQPAEVSLPDENVAIGRTNFIDVCAMHPLPHLAPLQFDLLKLLIHMASSLENIPERWFLYEGKKAYLTRTRSARGWPEAQIGDAGLRFCVG
jgi:hypothetical protein